MVRQGVGKGYGGVEWCLKVEDGGWNGLKAAARWGKGDGFLIFSEREDFVRLGW